MDWHDPVVLELCKRHGETDPTILISRLCRDLIDDHPTEHGPTPLNVLGSIQLIRECVPGHIPVGTGCSGLLLPENGGYRVIVNADEPPERQHFSFAHEIVHTLFREIDRDRRPSSEEEKLCDIGAAELTMPAGRFSDRMQDELLCFSTIEGLHQEFGTSFEAAARRSLVLTDKPACLFVASPARTIKQERSDCGEPVLRIVSWTASSTWPDDRCYKNHSVREASIIGQSFTNQDERSGRGALGTPFSSAEYEIEARGYAYARGAVADHRQVLALAMAS